MQQTKIAVIGSGIAGLTAGYLLRKIGCHVSVFERRANLGMDGYGTELDSNGGVATVDVPSRMFNRTQWPRLSRLYDELGVQTIPVDSSQSYSDNDGDSYLNLPSTLDVRTGLKLAADARTRQILTESRRLLEIHSLPRNGRSGDISFGDFLQRGSFQRPFVEGFLYPLLSTTICTCGFRALDAYPSHILLPALQQIVADRRLLRTKLGTSDVVERLSANLGTVRTNTSIESIEHGTDKVLLLYEGQIESFDHVIVATQANTARQFIPTKMQQDHDVLKAIPYEDVRVTVHDDTSMMPRSRKDWSTFNMRVTGEGGYCTVWLNQFYGDSRFDRDRFQTIHVNDTTVPARLSLEHFLQRPTVNQQSLTQIHALESLHSLPDRRIWYVGSWAAVDIPLLETGVRSAEQVVEKLQ